MTDELKGTVYEGGASFRDPLNLKRYPGFWLKFFRFLEWWRQDKTINRPPCRCGKPAPDGYCHQQLIHYRTQSGRIRFENEQASLRRCGEFRAQMAELREFGEKIGLRK